MMKANWMRTGTALAVRVDGTAAPETRNRVQILCRDIADFARREARSGKIEHMQLHEEQDRLRLVLIPKAACREVLTRSDDFARQMQELSAREHESFRFVLQEM